MRLKPFLITLLLSINLLAFGQSKTITIDIKQKADKETYLVDFREKGFLVVSEGESHQVTYFDNNLNQIWKVNLEKGKFTKDDLRFHITESGKVIYVITTGQDNSNFIKSISSDGIVSEFVKIKYSVKHSFIVGENLIVEVVKINPQVPFEGYSRKDEPLFYLKFSPNLSFEKNKVKVPVVKFKGEKTYAHKRVRYGTSSGFYFGQRSEFSDATEYVKILKLNFDGSYKGLRFPFRINRNKENSSEKKISGAVHARTQYSLGIHSFYIEEDEQRIFIFRSLGNSFSISSHNLNGGLLSMKTIDLVGVPVKYKKWNSNVQMVDGEYLVVNLLFLIDDDAFELFSYSVDLDGTNLKEKKIDFNWKEPNDICYGKLDVPKQFDIFTLSEFGALSYFQNLHEIKDDDYGLHLESCRFLKRMESEILFTIDKKQIKVMLFDEK